MSDHASDYLRAEVCRKGLEAITNEMAVTLMRTSGSPIVTEGKDFSTAITDPAGEQVGFSTYVTFHVSTSMFAVKAILEQYGDDISPGDGFLVNDAHEAGSIHQGDCAIVMPYFHEGQLVAWGHVNEHMVDVGGAAVSGFSPGAKDVYSEGLRFAGTRIIRNGEILTDWERFLALNVRVSHAVLNDMRSMIAAHNTGQSRLVDLIDEFGLAEYNRFLELNKNLTERMVRSRVRALPDGVYHSRDWVEFDGHGTPELYALSLDLEIHGDSATLRFGGDPQADAFINATLGVVMGQAMTTLLIQLLYDVPVNAGIWRPFEFDLGPKGTIVNAIPPAPTSQGHMEVGMRINKMIADTVSQAASLSDVESVRQRVAGRPANGAVSVCLVGIDRRTGASTMFYPNSIPHCLGGGAQTTGDGLDTYGSQCVLGNGIPSVEIEESTAPMLILWREVTANSGGAGMRSGGRGSTMGIALRGADSVLGIGYNSVAEVVPGGFGGGLPGGASDRELIRDTNLLELLKSGVMPRPDKIDGLRERTSAKVASLKVREGDVFIFRSAGGGGLGDPLLRDPSLVAADVHRGYVSSEFASQVHGVVLDDDGAVNAASTVSRRLAVRTDRIGRVPERDAVPAIDRPVTLTADGWGCGYCGGHLCAADSNYRDAAVQSVDVVAEWFGQYEVFVRPRPVDEPAVTLARHYCPSCASCLAADVTVAGEPRFKHPVVTG